MKPGEMRRRIVNTNKNSATENLNHKSTFQRACLHLKASETVLLCDVIFLYAFTICRINFTYHSVKTWEKKLPSLPVKSATSAIKNELYDINTNNADVADLTGVVAVLFCGICQAHYTYNNLSSDSRRRTKRFFELLNFLAESFIFSYIGVSMFTFPKHQFDIGFILCGFLCAALGRAANIYPLSFILNLGRKPKIPSNFQHMLFFSGIRGAMSFALAIRNTVSDARQKMLTTTSLIVIATVIIQGGAALPLLNWFKIPTGVDEEIEALPEPKNRREESPIHSQNNSEKSFLARIWGNFDVHYMKPLLTQSSPTLIDTLPTCLGPVARLLTTTEQLTQSYGERSRSNSEYGTTVEPSVSRHSLQSDNAEEREGLRSSVESSNFI